MRPLTLINAPKSHSGETAPHIGPRLGMASVTPADTPANGRDPAEAGYLRFFYRGWRPTPLGRIWSRAWTWLSGAGLASHGLAALQVRDRNDGRLRSTVLVVAPHRGHEYLVSMLGDGSEWVRNVRAARGRAVIKHGRSRSVLLTELPPQQRPPILKAWCQVATSGRHHLPIAPDAPIPAFNAIARDYPVFRIDPA